MDNGRVSYEEAVEAIRNWSKEVYEFSDDDVETIYANGRPIDMVKNKLGIPLLYMIVSMSTGFQLEISRR